MAMRCSLSTIPDPDPVSELGKWNEVEAGESVTISSLHLANDVVLEMSNSKEPGGLVTRVVRVPRNNTPNDRIIDGYEVRYSNGLQRYFTAPSQIVTGNEVEPLTGVSFTFSVEGDADFVLHNEQGKVPAYYRLQKLNDSIRYGSGVQIVQTGEDATLDGHLDVTKKIVAFTTRGLGRTKYLHSNEDCVGFGNRRVVVADGVGSHYHSELASHLVVESIVTDPADFDQSIGDASVHLNSYNTNFNTLVTENIVPDVVFVAVEVNGNFIRVVHCGDAKWRLFHNGKVIAASKDFSRVQELLDAGLITEKEAVAHRERNIVTSTALLGLKSFRDLNAPPGSILMLCTDGLDGVTDEEIMNLHKNNMNKYTVMDEIQKLVALRNNSGMIPASYREDGRVKLDYFAAAPCDNVAVAFVYF
jgi:serine/threonine protein phosphatase PrpC